MIDLRVLALGQAVAELVANCLFNVEVMPPVGSGSGEQKLTEARVSSSVPVVSLSRFMALGSGASAPCSASPIKSPRKARLKLDTFSCAEKPAKNVVLDLAEDGLGLSNLSQCEAGAHAEAWLLVVAVSSANASAIIKPRQISILIGVLDVLVIAGARRPQRK